MTRKVIKQAGILLLLLGYILSSAVISVLPAGRTFRRKMKTRNTSLFSTAALAVFSVRVSLTGEQQPGTNRKPRLVVANHVSYVDVLVIASLMPSVFITSVELKQTALLGMLARFGGSLFIERRKPSYLKREIAEISRLLEDGFTIVLFPEGTTSNGTVVQPFKISLFDAAISAKADILPICLRYTTVNGEPVSSLNRDAIFYYGGISFLKHFPKFLSLKSATVEATALKLIEPCEQSSRKDLALRAHEGISRVLNAKNIDVMEPRSLNADTPSPEKP